MNKPSKRDIGKKGEKIAIDYLKQQDYKIITQNYNSKVGEIDIIAQEKETLVFIEVKYRSNINYGLPSEAINYRKIQHICRTAQWYLNQHKWDKDVRFDVIEIIEQNGLYKIELIRNAFENPL